MCVGCWDVQFGAFGIFDCEDFGALAVLKNLG